MRSNLKPFTTQEQDSDPELVVSTGAILLLEGNPGRFGTSQQIRAVQGTTPSHMFVNHKTSTQQRRAAAACLPQARRRMPAFPLPTGDYEAKDDGAERSRLSGARPLVNATRVSVVRAMRELDRPGTVEEICERLDEDTPLANVEYHLSTLAAARIVKPVFGGPELRFQLVSEGEEAERFSGSGAISAYGVQAH